MAALRQSQTITFTTRHRWAESDLKRHVVSLWYASSALVDHCFDSSKAKGHSQPATMLLRWGEEEEEEGRDKSKDASFSAW